MQPDLRDRTVPRVRPDELQAVGLGAHLLHALFQLTDRQRYVVIQRHVRGRTQQSIADELRTSRQAISLSEQRAMEQLRFALAGVEEELAA